MSLQPTIIHFGLLAKGVILRLLKLLRYEPGVNAAARDNYAIILASQYGKHEVVEYLLNMPGVNAAARENLPIIKACEYGRHEVVIVLLTVPGRVNAAAKENLPIILASPKWGHLEVVIALREDGRVVTAFENGIGTEAVQLALDNGNTEIANLLLAYVP
jgi:hypothetical protein